jgi:CSLREA domain-containing protein
LADNGGPTQTIALLQTSPAAFAGSNALATDRLGNPLTTDQRGDPRISGFAVDIGAYQFVTNESLVVTTLTDEDNGTSDPTFGSGTSLREAILYADSLTGPQAITFAPGLTGTISLTLGELDVTGNVQIQGPGARLLLVDASDTSRVFKIDDGTAAQTTVGISGLTITAGYVTGDGGGILNRENLTLANVTLLSNTASGNGGGIENSPGASLTVTGSTFAYNTATGGSGGGIDNNQATAILTNSTLWGNVATQGGGISNRVGATLTLIDTTVADNVAGASQTGGVLDLDTSTVYLLNALLASNTGGDFSAAHLANAHVQGNDLVQDGSLVGFNVINKGPLLGPLQNNGGATDTVALLPGSPAVNAGVGVSGLTTDQRGTSRDAWPDIGAYEFTAFKPSLVVTTLTDEDNHTSDPRFGTGTSLREALEYANSLPGPSTITFDPSVFAMPQTITLTLGTLDILSANQITIDGGAAGVTLDGNHASRIFHVYGGTNLSLAYLTLSNGSAAEGGAIYNESTLTVTACTFSGNQGTFGGGIFSNDIMTLTNSTFANNNAAQGGAIDNVGIMTLTNCTIAANGAHIRGGGIFNVGSDDATLNNTLVAGNTLNGNPGGDLYGAFAGSNDWISDGSGSGLTTPLSGNPMLDPNGLHNNGGPTQTIALSPSSLAVAAASTTFAPGTDQRGAVRKANPDIGAFETGVTPGVVVVTTLADEDNGSPAPWLGAGISLREAINYANADPGADTITFAPSLFAGGPATITLGLGQLNLTDPATTTIQGPGANLLTISGANVTRVFDIQGGADISGLTVANGRTVSGGGGLFVNGGAVELSNDVVTNCTAASGGGMFVPRPATVTLMDVTFAGNQATASLGGGGALCLIDATASLTNCTVANNTGAGGGGLLIRAGTATLTNVTVAGNSANGPSGGGGLFVDSQANVQLNNVLVVGNSATESGGGVLVVPIPGQTSGRLVLSSALLAANTAGVAGPDLSGSVDGSSANDVIGFTGGVHTLGQILAVGANGNPLVANNGGPTPTIALVPGSPAIDSGANALAVDAQSNPLTTDQRGLNRISGAIVDLGAFEVQRPRVSTTTLPSGSYGRAYSQSIGATEAGYQGAFTYAVTTEVLPSGLNLSSSGTLSGTATAVGSYAFTVTATDNGGFAANQAFTVTVAPALLTITANAQTKTVGAADPTLTYQVTAGSLFNGDLLSGSLTRDAGEAVGSYAIRQGSLTAGGNYALSFVNSALFITSASTSLASAQSVAVSSSGPATTAATTPATATAPQLTATASGFDGGLTVAQYTSAPVTGFSASGSYFDADLASSNLSAASAVQLAFHNLTPAAPLLWWNGSTWAPVQDASGNNVTADSSGAATVTLTTTTSPSLSNLVGTYFLGGFLQPAFTVAGQQASYGSSVTISGALKDANLAPAGDQITATLGTQTASAAVAANGSFTVTFKPSSLPPGNYSVTYAFAGDKTFSPATGGSPLVINPAPLTASGVNFSATAGAPFSGTVATFTNADPLGSAASYRALITWGDGSTSAGVISGTSNTLTVSGSHTYADPVNQTVSVQIIHVLGDTTTATVNPTATVTSLGQGVQHGQAAGICFWHNKNGQALINSFNGGSSATALSAWLASTFPNLYGANAGANNLTGQSNAQVAAFYLSQFDLPGPKAQAEVLAAALNVYATTLSLGGTAAGAYGFTVSATGLGACSFNVGSDGAAFGVANNTVLNVYELLLAVNQRAVHGVLYNGDATLRQEAADLFDALNSAGGM